MLLSYEEALAQILASTKPIKRASQRVSLGAHGPIRVLAEPHYAADAYPRFDNSAVDGYAFHAGDLEDVGREKPVAFVVATGDRDCPTLEPGRAARIFTGAVLPPGSAAVAMQEDVEASEGVVTLREPLEPEAGIRRAGTDFKNGELLVEQGSPVTAGVAGILASQGITRPLLRAIPRCAVITTGDEIVPPERVPGPLQLRDSIGSMLRQEAKDYAEVALAFAPDDPDRLRTTLMTVVRSVDAVFIAGGASVGDRDFTTRVISEAGRVEFHGIRIRPGKPLLFGFVEGRPVIGLPGNPASAYVCFHLFGVPLLRRLGGWANPRHLWFPASYGAEHVAEARDVFARVALENGVASPTYGQGSFGLKSLVAAHALARLPEGTNLTAGDGVMITLL